MQYRVITLNVFFLLWGTFFLELQIPLLLGLMLSINTIATCFFYKGAMDKIGILLLANIAYWVTSGFLVGSISWIDFLNIKLFIYNLIILFVYNSIIYEHLRMMNIPRDKIAEFCKKNHITKLSLFGSALTDDFTEESDIDMIAEFEHGFIPGLNFFKMQDELSRLVNKKVDLNTPKFLSPYFRDQVLKEAKVIYAQ